MAPYDTDELTGLFNYRYFQKRLMEEVNRAKRYGRFFSLAFLGIDHFFAPKNIHGYLFADSLLREVAKILKESTRTIDIVARRSTSEFGMILPETKKEGALIVCERVRWRVEGLRSPKIGARLLDVITISAGIACFPEDAESYESLVDKAEMLLEQARRGGGNKVCATT